MRPGGYPIEAPRPEDLDEETLAQKPVRGTRGDDKADERAAIEAQLLEMQDDRLAEVESHVADNYATKMEHAEVPVAEDVDEIEGAEEFVANRDKETGRYVADDEDEEPLSPMEQALRDALGKK